MSLLARLSSAEFLVGLREGHPALDTPPGVPLTYARSPGGRPLQAWFIAVASAVALLWNAAPAAACGGENERACCVCEPGAACQAGLVEVPGCSGNCECAGLCPFSSSGTCRRITECGGEGQRACCLGEGSACGAGLAEVPGCTGNCYCGGGFLGTRSSATCRAVTECGGEDQRACCIGEQGGGCDAGLTEVSGCVGDCRCAQGIAGAQSSSTCVNTTECGGEGQRACCLGEQGGGCDPGLTEAPGCTGNCRCALGIGGAQSIGTCVQTTECGGANQRACCIAEGSDGACRDGLVEVPGCDGNCLCGDGVPGAQSSGTCQVPAEATSCGGEGQRACCGVTLEGANCGDGLVEVAGCAGNCLCGGVNPLQLRSSGTCHRPQPCGQEGQRACCLAERVASCDAGLTEIPGCSGDCFCGASLTGVVDDDALGTASGTCVSAPVAPMSEPAVGMSAPGSANECSYRGYADLHMHLFADIAHGGAILAGKPCPRADTMFCPEAFDTGNLSRRTEQTPQGVTACGDSYCSGGLDVNTALRACYSTDLELLDSDGSSRGPANCPGWLPDCGQTLFHGDHTLFDDAVGAVGTLDGAGPSQLGAPTFNGWPRWSSTTHQQVYYKWLERAWRGGLRLIVQLAVNNTALCESNKRIDGVDCNDTMAFIDQQLQAAYDFEQFVDLEVGQGVDADEGWFRIVRTPAEARQVLRNGKLAVVLGIEVDNLFNCGFPSSECTYVQNEIASCTMTSNPTSCRGPEGSGLTAEEWIRAQVDHYYDHWGVRHMFPVHNFDNAFGGAATWQSVIEVGNRFVEGHWYNTRDCSNEGYSFRLGEEGTYQQAFASLFGFEPTFVPLHPEAASCNEFGIFPLGEVLIEKMMDKGMIIDVDHMSARAFDDTVALVQQLRPGGYPLTASHALFTELNTADIRHERMRTPEQLAALAEMGGMVGVMLKDDVLDRGTRGERKTIDYLPSGIEDDCRHSSKTFAQAYAYSLDTAAATGMGSDFNGVAGHFGPRFGSAACGGDPEERSAQLRTGGQLQYPFELDDFGQFDRQVSGTKTFDYNVDGMAHVGLLPDFLADMRGVGVSKHAMDPMFRSAEAYVRMWELARGDAPAECCSDTASTETCEQALAGVYSVDTAGDLSFAKRDPSGTFSEPMRIGNGGWQHMRHVFPGGDGIIYAVNEQGQLMIYRDDNRDGTGQVRLLGIIGQGGWQNFVHLFSGGDGTIYAVSTAGELLFYRDHNMDGTGDLHSPTVIGHAGWQHLTRVFSGGDGVIYAITQDGKVRFYRDMQRDGTGELTSLGTIGQAGWQGFAHVLSGGDGVLYAITQDGEMRFYRDAQRDGTGDLRKLRTLASGGWQDLLFVFGSVN